jgi:hypothetical protein
MISLIVVPESTKVTIEVPAEFVNKTVHVDIRADEGVTAEFVLPNPDAIKYAEVKKFYSSLQKDLSDYCFDRNEANERNGSDDADEISLQS